MCIAPPPAIPITLNPPLVLRCWLWDSFPAGNPRGVPTPWGSPAAPRGCRPSGCPPPIRGEEVSLPWGCAQSLSAAPCVCPAVSVRPCPCVSEQLRGCRKPGCGWMLPGLLMRCRQPWVSPPHPAQGAVGQGQGWGRGGWQCRVQGEFGSDLHTGAVSRKATPV